jgi:hypothetical protein
MDTTDADALSLSLFALTLVGGIAFMAFRSMRATAREALEKRGLAQNSGPVAAD